MEPITIKIDGTKTRKPVPPVGGAMTPKRGKGAYKRKNKRNRRWEE